MYVLTRTLPTVRISLSQLIRFLLLYCRLTFIANNMIELPQQTQSNQQSDYMPIHFVKHFLPVIFASLLVSGCAFDVYRADLTPVQIDTSIATKASFKLREDVELDIGFGYKRHLLKGTIWNYMGTISYGDVYYSRDQILTIEASNIYEAYLVIMSETLVGFYLPVEDAYYPLAEPTLLPAQVAGNGLYKL